jgi:hypothetical protein
MMNSNPETVSTDYDTSSRLYFEPLTVEDVLNVIETERPDGIIVQFGGQTPLKLAGALQEALTAAPIPTASGSFCHAICNHACIPTASGTSCSPPSGACCWCMQPDLLHAWGAARHAARTCCQPAGLGACHDTHVRLQRPSCLLTLACGPVRAASDSTVAHALRLPWPAESKHLRRESDCECAPEVAGMRCVRAGSGNVAIWGTSPESIDEAEDRDKWYKILTKLDIKQPPGDMVTSEEQALAAAEQLGFPVMVRPSFVLGGRAMEIVYRCGAGQGVPRGWCMHYRVCECCSPYA